MYGEIHNDGVCQCFVVSNVATDSARTKFIGGRGLLAQGRVYPTGPDEGRRLLAAASDSFSSAAADVADTRTCCVRWPCVAFPLEPEGPAQPQQQSFICSEQFFI